MSAPAAASAANNTTLASVTAVVVTYNKLDYTRLCLEGILRTQHRPLEIVLVDNGSTEPTAPLVEEFEARAQQAGVVVSVIRNASNAGAPAARNQGIARADGDFLLFIDNDAVPFEQDWLDRMLDAFARLPGAGAVSARLLYPFPPHRIQFAGCGISRGGRVQYIGRGADRGDAEFRRDREVQCLISACLLMPASVVRGAGAFDEGFHPVQYEDLDLCYRIREQGWRCFVAGDAEVYHFENTTTDGSGDINFRYVTIKNGLLFKQRWRHRFEQEHGPSEEETHWLALEHRSLAELGPGWTPWDE